MYANRSIWTVNSRACFLFSISGPWLTASWLFTLQNWLYHPQSKFKWIIPLEIKPTCKGVTTGKHNASSALLALSGGSSVMTMLQKDIKFRITAHHRICFTRQCYYLQQKQQTYLKASTRCNESSAETLKLPSPLTALWYMWKRPSKHPQSFLRQSAVNTNHCNPYLENMKQNFNVQHRSAVRKTICLVSYQN